MDLIEFYASMIQLKRFFILLLVAVLYTSLGAQNSNSVYSRYGYGIFDQPAMGSSKAMAGVGFSLHESRLLNVLNPAAQADVDTLNLLYDISMTSQITKMSENGLKQSNSNLYFDHVGMKFALKRHWGMALGLYSTSKTGFEFYQIHEIDDTQIGDLNYTNSYKGSGGISTVFLGTGFRLFEGLSLGVNAKYAFGNLYNTMTTVYQTSGISSESNYEYLFVRYPGLDLGMQYDMKMSEKSLLTIGASYAMYPKVKNEFLTTEISSDTVENSQFYDFKMADALGLGITYKYDKRLIVSLDFQKKFFENALYMGVKDSLKNATDLAVGVEYLPSTKTDNFLEAIRYRGGFRYSDQYLKVPGKLKSAALTFGFGLPLRGSRSMLNLGFELGKLITPNRSLIQETYFKMSFGVTFNEMWFFDSKL